MKILQATCTLGRITIEHEYCALMQVWPLGHMRDLFITKGHSIQNARNLAVDAAIARDMDALFFYDDDMLPTGPDVVHKLITAFQQNEKIDVLAAVYPRRTPIAEPVCVEKSMGGPYWGWQDGKVHKCYMVGTGFTLYRVASLKKAIAKAPMYSVKSGALDGTREMKMKVKKVFRIDTQTDDFNFAEDFGDKLTQYVHGGAICQQIDLRGHVSDLSRAETKSLIV